MFGLLPGSTVLSDTNNHIETVVTEVETLTVTLGAVTDEGEGVVLEVFLQSRSALDLDLDPTNDAYQKLLTGPVLSFCTKSVSGGFAVSWDLESIP